MDNLQDFYLSKQEPNKSCLLAMREIILNTDKDISETKKYGMPCFCYREKMFCYIWVDKHTDAPYFLMVEGKHLNYPELEVGKRSRMKVLRINPKKDLPISLINSILKQAIFLYKNGLIKIKQ